MKKIMILIFVALAFTFNVYGNAENPIEPASPGMKTPGLAGAPRHSASDTEGPAPKGVEPGEAPPGMAEIFFAASTVSADNRYLYVIFDRFLLQYALPALDLMRKVDLNIASAPVTPSISISKDSKYLYVISNGMLYQIDATTFKIEKQIRITP